jgi:hypothetical protein
VSIFRPDWFNRLNLYREDERLIRNRYLIKSAALVFDPSGSMEVLADELGIHYHSLLRLYGRQGGVISPEMAVRLEQAVGANALPKKLLRPDLFVNDQD